ncbi:hypothetical protein ACFRCG_07110 [Embleya sp. NPDC056575]
MTAQMCTGAGRYLQAFAVAWIHEPEEFASSRRTMLDDAAEGPDETGRKS